MRAIETKPVVYLKGTPVGFPKGLCKVKKFQKSKINLDGALPTHPPPSELFFGNPSLTWTYNQIIISNNYTVRIHMVYYS